MPPISGIIFAFGSWKLRPFRPFLSGGPKHPRDDGQKSDLRVGFDRTLKSAFLAGFGSLRMPGWSQTSCKTFASAGTSGMVCCPLRGSRYYSHLARSEDVKNAEW